MLKHVVEASGDNNMFRAKLAFQLPERFRPASVLRPRENVEGLPVGLGAIQRHATEPGECPQQSIRASAVERFEYTLRLQQDQRTGDLRERIEVAEIAQNIRSMNPKPVKEFIGVIEVDLGCQGKKR